MKTIIQIVLAIVIVVLGYFIYDSIMEPVRFNQEVAEREGRVIDQLKDIRDVQRAHRSRYNRFNSDLDSLVEFVRNDSLPVIRAIGSVPDTLTETEAVELGLVERDTLWVKAADSLKRRGGYPMDSLPYIPYSGGERFTMDAGKIERGLTELPVFEAYALPPDYMKGVHRWRVYHTRDTEEGLRVGTMQQASIDGNWE